MAGIRNRIGRLVPAAIMLAAISAVFWLALIWRPVGVSELASDIYMIATITGVLAGIVAIAPVAIQKGSGTRISPGTVTAALLGLSALVVNTLLWVGNFAQQVGSPEVSRQLDLSDEFFVVSAVLIPVVVFVATLPMRRSTCRLAIRLGSVAIFWSPVLGIGHGIGITLAFKVIREHLVFDYDLYGLTATCMFITWLIMLAIARALMNRPNSASSSATNDR